MRTHQRWNESRPPDAAWRPSPDLTRAGRVAEQDTAAGGRAARRIALAGGGSALASVALRVLPQGRRVYAYLRWSEEGRTREKYIGEVTGADRQTNLTQAWEGARARTVVPATTEEPRPSRRTRTEVSWASSDGSRAVMRANRGRDTRPELALRSAVHALGLRYRVNARPEKAVRRTADLVFTKVKVAVFLDGCFWHGCPHHYRTAKGPTADFWRDKIDGNKRRDADTDQRLADAGWMVVRVWEHDDPHDAADRILRAVAKRRA